MVDALDTSRKHAKVWLENTYIFTKMSALFSSRHCIYAHAYMRLCTKRRVSASDMHMASHSSASQDPIKLVQGDVTPSQDVCAANGDCTG